MLLDVIRVLELVENGRKLDDLYSGFIIFGWGALSCSAANARHLKLLTRTSLLCLHVLCQLLSKIVRNGRAERRLTEFIKSTCEELALDHVHHLVGELALQTTRRKGLGLSFELSSDILTKFVIEFHLN